MGIIAKQSIRGTVYTYSGAGVGFVNTVLLMPKIFSTEQVGLVNILVAIAIIYTQIASLGFPNVLSRVFPHFRNTDNGHNGMFTLGILVSTAGFIITYGIFALTQNYIIEANSEKSALLVENLHYIPVLIIFTVFFTFFDNYAKVLFDSVSGTALREFYARLLILADILLYYFGYIDFEVFIPTYIAAYNSPAIIMILILIIRRQFRFTKFNKTLMHTHKKEIIRVAAFGIMSGFAGTAIVNIDTYMVTQYLGLSQTGIYAISFYFGTLIGMPARSLRKISSIMLSEAWKRNDMAEIQSVYEKSTTTQLIIGLFLFLGVWVNIDNIFTIIPEYAPGKYVIFFIALGNILDMAGGLSAMIMLTSKHYNLFSHLSFANVIFVVVSNMVFIPLLGLRGAALASALTWLSFTLIRFFFLKTRYSLQPYSFKHLKIIILAILAYSIPYLLPAFKNAYIDIFFKGTLLLGIFLGLIYISKVSEDINKSIETVLKKILRK